MKILQDIKKWLRCRSWDFVVNSVPGRYSKDLKKYKWKGHTVYYRAGKADVGTLYEILIRPSRTIRPNKLIRVGKKLEYWVPPEVAPKVILDIGGNIGTTSVYYSHLFPDAKIYTFEPVKDNYAILEKNTAALPNVTTFNVGLGASDSTPTIFAYEDNDNTGGYSLYDLQVDKAKGEQITVKHAGNFLKENNITHVDLIKIDTEGAEYDILTSMEPEMLANVRWIIGELHGERDFELFTYLSKWFDLDVKKSLRSRLHDFNARNKSCADSIPWKG